MGIPTQAEIIAGFKRSLDSIENQINSLKKENPLKYSQKLRLLENQRSKIVDKINGAEKKQLSEAA